MRWIRFAVLLLFITILQASIIDKIAVSKLGVRPDLLLVLLVFFAVSSNPTEAIITSFIIGFAVDLTTSATVTSSAMGPGIISFGVFGTLLAHLNNVLEIRRVPSQVAAIFIMGTLVGFSAYFLSLLREATPAPEIYKTILATSLFSSIVGPVLFLPCSWWMRIKVNRSKRR